MINERNSTWQQIGKLREEALAAREKFGRAPKELVNKIEDIQRQFDEESGFSLCQMESHTIALRISQNRKKAQYLLKIFLVWLKIYKS